MTRKNEARFDQRTTNNLLMLKKQVISAAKGNYLSITEIAKENCLGNFYLPKLTSELKLLASFTKGVRPVLRDITAIQTVIDAMKERRLNNLSSELHNTHFTQTLLHRTLLFSHWENKIISPINT